MTNYTYMLSCGDGTLYTGWTNHLHRRLLAHRNGRGARYTKSRQPVRLVYAEAFDEKEQAMSREYAIKQLDRRQKEALIMSRPDRGRLFYLMGKSASGKDTVYRKLLEMPELELKRLTIGTTRPARDGERQGEEYHFTDEAHLQADLARGKVIELREYQTACGVWKYFTLDDGSFDGPEDRLGIGTPEAFRKLRDYLGPDRLVPIYIEVEDGLRLQRALDRERGQETPRYEELCRRFLADQEDFSPEKLEETGIKRRFANNGAPRECLEEAADYILLKKWGREG